MAYFKSLFNLTLLAVAFQSCTAVSITCTTTKHTLEDLVSCLYGYTVPANYYRCAAFKFATAQIQPYEVTGWTEAVTKLLNAGGTCSLPADSPVSGSYQVTDFTDHASGRHYCVLSEINAVTVGTKNYFTRGWGTFIVPRDVTGSTKTLHHSAPHPIADTNTPQQAAAIFRRTNSRSLLIAGRHRDALSAASTHPPPLSVWCPCAINSCADAAYTKTDPVHDVNEPFNLAMISTRTWQNAQIGRCPSAKCAYLQWHGKGTTCASDNVFLTSGIDTGTCYGSSTLPINRIKRELNNAFPGHHHYTPADDPACPLTATRNVFGRLVNGVPSANLCTTAATGCGGAGFGQFVHMEQEAAYRTSTNYDKWANVIMRAFP